MKFYLGIDFGSANIMVAIAKEEGDEIKRLSFKNERNNSAKLQWLPNWYAITQDGKEHFGWDAKNIHEELARNDQQSDIDFFFNYKIHLHEFNSDTKANQGGRAKHAMEKVLGFIRKRVDQYLRERDKTYEIARLVVTVPVGWAESKTRELYLEVIGKVFPAVTVRLVSEPVAASVPLLDIIHKDGEEKNCLIVDIGASTLDVSLVRDVGTPPLVVEKGEHNTFAGDYCDKQIAAWLQSKRVASEKDAIHKAIELKEAGKHDYTLSKVCVGWATIKGFKEALYNLLDDVKKSWHKQQAKKISKEMAQKAVKTIELTLTNLEGKITRIDYLIFCGGMSNFEEWGYIGNIVQLLKTRNNSLMQQCIFDNELPDVERFSDEMREMAIAKGAARLAKDPGLVVEKLGYDVGAVLTFKGKSYYPPVISSNVKLLSEKQEFSFYESVLKLKEDIPEINNNGFTLRPKDTKTLPIWFAKPGGKKHIFNARMNNSWAQSKLDGDEEIIVLPDSSYDIYFTLDERGIIQMNLVDLQSEKIAGTAHYDVNAPHELNIG